jgi:hypothetical protein
MDLYFVEGSYYYEGPLNVPEKRYIHCKRPITVDVILDHVLGKKSICAPSCHNGFSKWITLDIDSDDINSVTTARDIITSKGYPVYVSFSGGKGYHLTIYLNEPTLLSTVQQVTAEIQTSLNRLAIPVCKISPSPHGNGGDGMKLPLGIHPETGNYCYFIDGDLNPVNDSLSYLLAIQTIEVNGHKKCEVNPITGEIPLEFPGEISNKPCVNKLWQDGVQAPHTRHYATLVIANAIVRSPVITYQDKETAIAYWVYKTHPKAGNKISTDLQYMMGEAVRLLIHYQRYGTYAELCTNQVFKAAMRSACEDEFGCMLAQNHGHSNFRLLRRLGLFNAPNAKPKGLGKSAMALYFAIEDIAVDFPVFQFNGLTCFSLSTQQLVYLSNLSKRSVITHRKRLIEVGLVLKVCVQDIPSNVLDDTPIKFRNSFYALADISNENTVREVFERLRVKVLYPSIQG